MMRLTPLPGEWIRRDRSITFHFEGKRYQGLDGDTITSALLANGLPMLGRSFKYHRPRSVLSAANHDVNNLLQCAGLPNLRADVTPLVQGQVLTAVNVHGSLARDGARLLDMLAPLLPVGFYYKAFHSRLLFPIWEKLIRHMSGLGKIDITEPRRRTAKRHDFCDVLVVGGGATGLSAALAAAQAGAQVLLVDENARAGGSDGYDRGGAASPLLQSLLRQAGDHKAISLRTATVAAGAYADGWIALVDPLRITKLRARSMIIASGAIEQPSVFSNNDLPGVMLASAAQRLIYRYAVKPFERVVVLTANDEGYRAALDFKENGIEVAAVVDMRAVPPRSAAVQKVEASGWKVYPGHCIYSASAKLGRVSSALISPFDGERADSSRAFRLGCDGVAMSTGWAPASALLHQAGAGMRYSEAIGQFIPADLPEGVFAAGRVNGVYGLERKIADGKRAGLEAATWLGLSMPDGIIHVVPEHTSRSHPWPIVGHPHGKNFVDFDEDLQLKDFENAAQEGFDSIELLKRYTTVGMGPSQGKHSSMNAIRILARMRGETPGEIGATTQRPFVHPVPLSHLAGRGLVAERETPLHERHLAAGAVLMSAGNWQRPEYYAQPGRSREGAIHDEARAVRTGVGLIDVGTLGKIEIIGPDAAAFLERIYAGRYANMRSGTTRYGVMLDDMAVVIDDGVIARLGEERFYFTTTTSGSATVYRELSRLNTQWRMNCGIVNLTGHMAAMNLAGPGSRAVLQSLSTDALDDASFPYLAARTLRIAGIETRVLRIGFVGELGYEIHVTADYGTRLWDALLEAGRPHGLQPFGVEAQRLLRLEKGHVIIGQDTDGLTNPDEAGLAWAVKMDKPFFIGQRSLAIIRKRPLKQQLAGFRLEGQGAEKVRECHLIIAGGDMAGRITSVAWSPALNQHIGLAFLRPSLATMDEVFDIRASDGTLVSARVIPAPFYDAQGQRQRPGAPLARAG